MAGTTSGPRSGSGNIPPRPGGKRPVPKRPTGKPPANFASRSGRPPQKPAQRASARQAVQAQRQRNIYLALGAVGLVVVLIAIFVTAKLAGGGSSSPTATNKKFPSDTFALTSALVNQAQSVPLKELVTNAEAALAADKKNSSSPSVDAPYKINGSSLTLDGHPEMLFVGAEYCPYCAAERWTLVMALQQFGQLSGLRGVTSSATDVNPSTPTFSFYNARYTSKYLAFVPVEEETNSGATLQNPTASQNAILSKWDVSPYTDEDGSIPFVYLDGKYLVTGLQYSAEVASHISGDSFSAADSYITSGTNQTSRAAMAAAGFLVGDICTLTHNQPASVCSAVPASLKGVNASDEASGGASSGSSSPRSSTTKTTAAKPTTTAAKPSTSS